MIVEPSGRVVVFGATGFTGELVARALIDRGVEPVLAGRRADALHQLRERLGRGEVRVADADRPETVRALVDRGDVLATTVGPFARYGEAAVAAAVERGAHYLDPAGEGQFVRRVLTVYGPLAREAGVALLPAFGFESVPGNLAAALALESAPVEPTTVEVLYVCDPRVSSGGTRASAADVVLERAFAYRDGRVVERRVAARNRLFEVAGRRIRGLSIPSSEHLTLPRSFPQLRDVEVYLGGFGVLTGPLRVVAAVGARMGEASALRRLATTVNRRFFPSSTGGPDPDRRAKTTTYLVARAYRDDQRVSEVTLAGPDPYRLTADFFAWAIRSILDGGLRRAGGLGPCEAFGTAELAAAAEQMGLRPLGTDHLDKHGSRS